MSLLQLTDNTLLIKDEDGNYVECQVLGYKMKESVFQKSAPILSINSARFLFFLNFIPGNKGLFNKKGTLFNPNFLHDG